MNIILSHLAFLFFSILILYLVRKENFSGAAHGLISFISVIFVFFITFSFHEISNNKIILFEFIENAPISFYIDSLGLVFLIISNLLWFCVAIYATRYLDINKYDKKGDFYIFFLISMFATNAIVYSSNLITNASQVHKTHKPVSVSTATVIFENRGRDKIILESSLI